MYDKQGTLRCLSEHGVDFTVTEHQAVFTMEQMDSLGLCETGCVCKNLFLFSPRGKQYYLVALHPEKRADLRAIAGQLNCGKLSFASPARLMEKLGLTPGAVSPLGLLNNDGHDVVFAVDTDLLLEWVVGVHPNENTATVWLSPQSLLSLIGELGNPAAEIEA